MDDKFEYIVCDFCDNDKTKLLAKQTDLIHELGHIFYMHVHAKCTKMDVTIFDNSLGLSWSC